MTDNIGFCIISYTIPKSYAILWFKSKLHAKHMQFKGRLSCEKLMGDGRHVSLYDYLCNSKIIDNHRYVIWMAS